MVSAADNSSIACVSSDPGTGAFLVAAGIGAYVRLTAAYMNHSMTIDLPAAAEVREAPQYCQGGRYTHAYGIRSSTTPTCSLSAFMHIGTERTSPKRLPAPFNPPALPPSLAQHAHTQADAGGAFELTQPLYDVDVRDVQTRQLRLGLIGGLCQYGLGAPVLQFTAYDCDDQAGQPPVSGLGFGLGLGFGFGCEFGLCAIWVGLGLGLGLGCVSSQVPVGLGAPAAGCACLLACCSVWYVNGRPPHYLMCVQHLCAQLQRQVTLDPAEPFRCVRTVSC